MFTWTEQSVNTGHSFNRGWCSIGDNDIPSAYYVDLESTILARAYSFKGEKRHKLGEKKCTSIEEAKAYIESKLV